MNETATLTRMEASREASGQAGSDNGGAKPAPPASPLDRVLSKLKGVEQTKEDCWKACCPAHDDSNPSLSVGLCENGGVWVKCFAGCAYTDILKALGLSASDLATSTKTGDRKPWGRIETTYDYSDEAGKLLFQAVRFVPKSFRQRRPDPDKPGAWIWGLKGVRLVLYRLPAVIAARQAGERIFLTEGEKDADALVGKLGVCATCNPMGAGKWRDEYSEALAGADVVLLPDKDEAGRRHRDLVARALQGRVKSLRVLEFPDRGGHQVKDAGDWLQAGGSKEEFEALLEAAGEWKPGKPVSAKSSSAIRSTLWDIAQDKTIKATEAHREGADAVVGWLHERGRFYHHRERRSFDSVMFFDSERKLLLDVRSDAFLAWLADMLNINRAERLFDFCSAACENEGLSDRAEGIDPACYWAAREGAVYLSNGPGLLVRITAGNIELLDNGADGILFPYAKTLLPWELVEPQDPFETCALFREISASAAHAKDLLRLWVFSLPTDQRTKPPLCVAGTIGSGKTRLVVGVFDLFGMPPRISAIQKNGENDFWVAMEAGGLACFDNADTRIDWLPDALAAAATGGAVERRKLYKDTEQVHLRARSWVAVTSAQPSFAADAGLADRLLVVRLDRRQGETAETALSDEVRAHRNASLSWVAHTLSRALEDKRPVPGGLNARHPDFADLAVRIGRAIGREQEAIAALRAAEADKGLFNIENDTVGAALIELVRDESFEGTAGDLLGRIKEIEPAFEGKLTAKGLGKRLSRLWPHLESVFNARQTQDRTRARSYFFSPPSSGAEFAEYKTPFSGKSYARENIGGLMESASETLQSLHPPTCTGVDPACDRPVPPATEVLIEDESGRREAQAEPEPALTAANDLDWGDA